MNGRNRDAGSVSVGIEVDTAAVDEALEKIDALGDATADLAPMVSIRNCKGCTFNIYPSRNTKITGYDDEV